MHDPEQQKNKFTPNIQSKSPISDDITYEYIAHTLTLYHLSPSSQDPKGKNECIKWKSGEEMHSIERIKKNRERKNKHSELNTMQSWVAHQIWNNIYSQTVVEPYNLIPCMRMRSLFCLNWIYSANAQCAHCVHILTILFWMHLSTYNQSLPISHRSLIIENYDMSGAYQMPNAPYRNNIDLANI